MYSQKVSGSGSASPYSDCVVTIRVKIVIENKTVFSNFDAEKNVEEMEGVTYDLENYEVPGVVRKIIKKMKKGEVVRVVVNNSKKVNDNLLDPHQIFRQEWLKSARLMLEIQLLDWFQKEFVFRLPVKEKIERV